MARFKTVKKEFAALPNEVIQGFYLSANALAILITCLSYPNDWNYRPIHLWKNLKLSRDKTYAAFDELVEKGHCIRIRHLRGNLHAELDYIFFDEIKSCQNYIKENHEDLQAKDIKVEHKWNFKKFLRHPEYQDPEVQVPEGQEVTKTIETKKISKQKDIKESIKPIVHNSPPAKAPPDSISAAQGSIPLHKEKFSIDLSSPEVLEIIELEPKTKPHFKPHIITRWIENFGAEKVLETIKFFFQVKEKQKTPILKPEAWMEKALKEKFAEGNETCQKNKSLAENMKKRYDLRDLKINKRYCQDTLTGKDYYYHLPENTFKELIYNLIGNKQ